MSRGVLFFYGFGWILTASPLRAEIVITEIHYDPVDDLGTPRPDLEFVEIANDGPEPYDLSGYQFTRGLSYIFPEGTFLDGRSYLVVCRDESAVRAYYGISSTVGNFFGTLDNSGETIELSNQQGAAVTRCGYNDRGQWPGGARGTGHSLSIESEYRDPDDPDSWRLSTQRGGTPGRRNFDTEVSFEDTTIVADDAVWRYFKGQSAPPAAWRTVGFNDSGWLSGQTGIGYGDGDDRTVLNDMQGSYRTIFCRRAFTVADRDEIESLVLRITYDDGFVAYLNGTEVARRNVDGPNFDDDASSAGEPNSEDVDISAFVGQVVNGTNVLAVSVHNAGLNSSDLSFIPELVSRRTILPEEIATVPVVVNEGHFFTSGVRFVELYNDSDNTVNIGGLRITDNFADLTKFTIAANTMLAGHGFVAFTEAQLGFDLEVIPGTRDRVEIALVNRAGTRVVDARIFEPKQFELSEARLPDGEENFSPAATPTPGAANVAPVANDIVINEIMYHPISGLERDEFVELFHRGTVARDLTGWSLSGVGFEFPPGLIMAPGEYLVIAKDPANIRAKYGLSSTVVLDPGYTGRLSNGGERLELLDERKNTVDKVRYHDDGAWPTWADGLGSSLEKIDPRSDGRAGNSWDASDDSSKAVVQSFSYTAQHGGGESDLGILLLDEGIAIVDNISLVSVSGGSNLVSNGTFDTNTSGWRIEGTHVRSGRTTNASERLSGGGSLKLICHNGTGDYKVNRCETNTGTQSNGATYRVSFDAKWRVGSRTILTIGDYNVGNPSSAGLAGANTLAIPSRLGSPGAQNIVTARQQAVVGAINLGPAIDRVEHDPAVPEANESVRVRARVRDPDGVSTVRLRYRTETASGTFSQVTMTDADGNGIFSGMIPGQSLGTRVIFYVEATDGSGVTERYPRDVLARSHPPVVNPASAAARDERYLIYRHDTRFVSTSAHDLRFVMHEENESELGSRTVLSNEMMEGTFIFAGTEAYHGARLRFAGSPWLRPGGGSFQKSYSVKIPKDNPLHGRKTAFNLDEHGNDGRERYSHFLFRRTAGSSRVPYYDFMALTRFQLNDVYTGTHELLDKPNQQYLDFWFPEDSDGAHFEMDDRFSFNDSGSRTGNAEGKVLYPPYGSTAGGGDKENYRWYFASRNRKGDDDFSELIAMCRVMDSRTTSNTLFDQTIFQTLDVEEVCRVLAVERNIDHWDTWGGNRGKNCYWFQDPTTGLWSLIPWDIELTYDQVTRGDFNMPNTPSGTIGGHFSEVTRFLNRPRIKRLYYGVLSEMLDVVFYTGGDSPLSAYASAMSGSGVNAGNVLNFVSQRRNYLLSRVQPAVSPSVRLVIDTNGGQDFTATEPLVDLDGDAPADIFSLLVQRNGELLDEVEFEFSTSSMTGWTIRDIPLGGGVNTLVVLGFNGRGELVDQDTIRVTNPVDWERPVVQSIAPSPAAMRETITVTGVEFHDGLRVFFGATEAASVVFDEGLNPTEAQVVVPDTLVAGTVQVTVRNIDGQVSLPFGLVVLPPEPIFVRGDTNLDGRVNVSDGVTTFRYLFAGLAVGCVDALDADDDGTVRLNDGVRILDFIFRAGTPPAAPYPAPGRDAGSDALGCETSL